MAKIRFGAVLRERRAGKGWTQEQMATQADLSTRYIQALEAAEKAPSLETVFKIARAFGTSPGALLEPLWREWKESKLSSSAKPEPASGRDVKL